MKPWQTLLLGGILLALSGWIALEGCWKEAPILTVPALVVLLGESLVWKNATEDERFDNMLGLGTASLMFGGVVHEVLKATDPRPELATALTLVGIGVTLVLGWSMEKKLERMGAA